MTFVENVDVKIVEVEEVSVLSCDDSCSFGEEYDIWARVFLF